LVVGGSRGLHGFGALGAVSERVAQEGNASVLVARRPTWHRADG
jgi:nucleotide-binding universal stress UspA family protein